MLDPSTSRTVRPRRHLLAVVLALAACGGELPLGTECPGRNGFCKPEVGDMLDPDELLPVGGECLQIKTAPHPVAALDHHAEFCQVVTLHTTLGKGATVYLTEIDSRATHDIFVMRRPVGTAPPLEDGTLDDCGFALAAGGFQPLASSPRVLLRAGAVEMSDGDQLLLRSHYKNTSTEEVEVPSIVMNLTCQLKPPSVYVHQFAFNGSGAFDLRAGEADSVEAECTFSKEVVVLMVYRQNNHALQRYQVDSFGAGGFRWEPPSEELWFSLDDPMRIKAGGGFRWNCDFFNAQDAPIRVPAGASSGCSLFGFYALPGGIKDVGSEGCDLGP